jgi:ferrochelatase
MAERYDALLIVSFGGPEGVDEVIPFLENVLRGRNVSRDRMLAVAEHYYRFGGVSPLNEQNRKLIEALRIELEANGPQLPIYWGNRNWHPLLKDTIQQMTREGVKRALAFVTAAYSSYSSCRQYLENIAKAQEGVGAGAPRIDKIRVFYNHPGFIQANVENVSKAMMQIPESRRPAAQLVFTAHNIPLSMARSCRYENQLLETSRLVSAGVAHSLWTLAYQSRSGSTAQPWLDPELYEKLRSVRDSGIKDVVISPIGFVADHMEVVYDLDVEAKELCAELGINLVRASSAGSHPTFVRMIRDLIVERIDGLAIRPFLGNQGPSPDVCAPGCCLF